MHCTRRGSRRARATAAPRGTARRRRRSDNDDSRPGDLAFHYYRGAGALVSYSLACRSRRARSLLILRSLPRGIALARASRHYRGCQCHCVVLANQAPGIVPKRRREHLRASCARLTLYIYTRAAEPRRES